MKKRLLVLGAGTAGTMIVNRLRPRLSPDDWDITVVDRDDQHRYQPGYLFLPFGTYSEKQVTRARHVFLPDGVDFVIGDVDVIRPEANNVVLTDGRALTYDYLVIASGTSPRPGPDARDARGGVAPQHLRLLHLRRGVGPARRPGGVRPRPARRPHHRHAHQVPGGAVGVHLPGGGVAARARLRDRVELVFVTPLPGAFTKPIASAHLGSMLDDCKIAVEADFLVEHIDDQRKALVSYDEREVPFDLLVTVPPNMGADFVARSGLGDELNYVPVDRHTLLSTAHANIFAVGDASDIPASKAGSVAHFSVEIFADNFLELVAGKSMTHTFDGHTNCFIESGDHKGLLIDFNDDTEPLPGKFPLPVIGPMDLLKETRANHLGKLAFRWIYWNVLLPGRPMPLPSHMSMLGKTTQNVRKNHE